MRSADDPLHWIGRHLCAVGLFAREYERSAEVCLPLAGKWHFVRWFAENFCNRAGTKLPSPHV